MGLSDNIKNNILNSIFNNKEFRSPLFIKLGLVVLDERSNTYIEVSDNNTGYSRQLVEFNKSVNCTLSNKEDIVFSKSTKRWGNITKLRLYAYYSDEDTGEEILELDLLSPRVIESGCNVTFNANSIIVNLN